MIPFVLVLTSSISLTLVFSITGELMLYRWSGMSGHSGVHLRWYCGLHILEGDMKVPTFSDIENHGGRLRNYLFFPIVGVIFGGIHCAGWFFYFPSSDEAMLWRISSAIIAGIPFLTPLVASLLFGFHELTHWHLVPLEFLPPLGIIALLVYVVSRLILLVEAFISLRHLTPGMLAVVKWTSFIPHI